MAKKKDEVKKEKPADRKNVLLAIPIDLANALESYRESCRPSPTLTGVLLVALEDHLKKQGFWK